MRRVGALGYRVPTSDFQPLDLKTGFFWETRDLWVNERLARTNKKRPQRRTLDLTLVFCFCFCCFFN